MCDADPGQPNPGPRFLAAEARAEGLHCYIFSSSRTCSDSAFFIELWYDLQILLCDVDPGQLNPGPRFLGEEAGAEVGPGSSGSPGKQAPLGKDGKPVPQVEKTWLQKNWLVIMIGAAVVRLHLPLPFLSQISLIQDTCTAAQDHLLLLYLYLSPTLHSR